MQHVYKKWKGDVRWDSPLSFDHFPRDIKPAFVSGRTLAPHGHSNVTAYYEKRHTGNVVRIYKTTGDLTYDGPIGTMTIFFVTRPHPHNDVTAADAVVSHAVAEDIVNLSTLQGDAVVSHMTDAGTISDFDETTQCHTAVH